MNNGLRKQQGYQTATLNILAFPLAAPTTKSLNKHSIKYHLVVTQSVVYNRPRKILICVLEETQLKISQEDFKV